MTLKMRGKVHNLKKESDSFTLNLNASIQQIQFFFPAPDWIVDGAEIEIEVEGGNALVKLKID